MNLAGVFFHLFDFLAPAIALGLLGAAAAKVLWRSELRSVCWLSLATGAALASLAAELAGLIVTGRDAKILTYMSMVLACAAGLWWGMRRR
jgi:hypothetical protein